MGKPISLDLRRAVISAYQSGAGSYETVAELLSIGRATVNRVLRLYRESGKVEPRPHGGGQVAKIGLESAHELASMIRDHPDWTIDEMTIYWKRTHNRDISRSAMVRALQRHGFTRKKRLSAQRNKTAPTFS